MKENYSVLSVQEFKDLLNEDFEINETIEPIEAIGKILHKVLQSKNTHIEFPFSKIGGKPKNIRFTVLFQTPKIFNLEINTEPDISSFQFAVFKNEIEYRKLKLENFDLEVIYDFLVLIADKCTILGEK